MPSTSIASLRAMSGSRVRPRVIKTVCSKWADGKPSEVQTVQPSSNSRTPAPPRLIIGSIARVMPCLEAWTAAAFAVIWDLRFFVQLPSHPVTDKFSHDAEVVANCFILDRRAKVAQSLVGTSKADGPLQRVFE